MNMAKKFFGSTLTFVLLLSLLSSFTYAASSQVGTVKNDSVNVRSSPSTSGNVVSLLYKGDKVSILKVSNGWVKVKHGNTTGWVKNTFINVASSTASKSKSKSKSKTNTNTNSNKSKITANNVNLRFQPKASAKVLEVLKKGANVTVYKVSGKWCKVRTASGKDGWVCKEYVAIKGKVSRGDSDDVHSSKGSQVVAYAKTFVGVDYVYGGSSPSGFDCSGFVKYVYGNYGVNLERVASSQAGQGQAVSRSELRTGDLVFFDTNGGKNHINHVGIYLGGGKFIHSSSGKADSVTISSLTDGFYDNAYMTARRIVD